MIPISLTWDTRGKQMLVRWNGFFSFGWEKGERVRTIFKIPVPCIPGPRKSIKNYLTRRRWIGLKEVVSFIKEWKLKRVEGTFSFEDPMMNGIFFGWLTALTPKGENRKINLTVNFLGENWCSGEATVSPKVVFHHFTRLFLLYLMKGRQLPKGG